MVFFSLLVVAFFGAMGAAARHWLSGAIAHRIGELFPLGTLAINLSGSILIGAAAAGLSSPNGASSLVRLGAITGFLGGYTTVSSFSLQTLNLWRFGEQRSAVLNIFASLVLCIGGTEAAFVTVRVLMS